MWKIFLILMMRLARFAQQLVAFIYIYLFDGKFPTTLYEVSRHGICNELCFLIFLVYNTRNFQLAWIYYVSGPSSQKVFKDQYPFNKMKDIQGMQDFNLSLLLYHYHIITIKIEKNVQQKNTKLPQIFIITK